VRFLVRLESLEQVSRSDLAGRLHPKNGFSFDALNAICVRSIFIIQKWVLALVFGESAGNPSRPESSALEYSPLMLLTLAHIGPRPGSKDEFDSLTRMYLERCSAFTRCQSEAFRSEDAMLAWLNRQQGRRRAVAVLLDSRGRQMTSEAFAGWLGTHRDEGAQHIVFAIGPANGWSDAARERAQLLLSLGHMTLAHALARLIMAEQLYRAFTILTGHPYHAGH
jgi:23S rRNA (pseudouridine1915-N3)-methyltransferase